MWARHRTLERRGVDHAAKHVNVDGVAELGLQLVLLGGWQRGREGRRQVQIHAVGTRHAVRRRHGELGIEAIGQQQGGNWVAARGG